MALKSESCLRGAGGGAVGVVAMRPGEKPARGQRRGLGPAPPAASLALLLVP